MRNPRIGGLLVLAYLSGCAHPMIVRPDMDRVAVVAEASRIPKAVGLYISPADLNKEVTTSGGGGDKVSYRPYADMETGLYRVLGNVFKDVEILKSMSDVDTIAKHSIVYIALPEITTTSSSTGVFTWMATDFTIQLTCKITDVAGRPVTSVSSTGKGHADFAELQHNISLAGERASTDALDKLQTSLQQSAELRK